MYSASLGPSGVTTGSSRTYLIGRSVCWSAFEHGRIYVYMSLYLLHPAVRFQSTIHPTPHTIHTDKNAPSCCRGRSGGTNPPRTHPPTHIYNKIHTYIYIHIIDIIYYTYIYTPNRTVMLSRKVWRYFFPEARSAVSMVKRVEKMLASLAPYLRIKGKVCR